MGSTYQHLYHADISNFLTLAIMKLKLLTISHKRFLFKGKATLKQKTRYGPFVKENYPSPRG
jgi:hypothetical protein